MGRITTYVSNTMDTKSDFTQNSIVSKLDKRIRVGAMCVLMLAFFQLSGQTTYGPLTPVTDVSINNTNGVAHSNQNVGIVKSGNTIYIKYDLTGVSGTITAATLDIWPASYGGPAVFKVSTGTDAQWSATNTATLPTAVTELTTHSMSTSWAAFTVDLGAIAASDYSSGTLNLIVEYVSGTNVGFARVGNTNPGNLDQKVPKLTVTATPNSGGGGSTGSLWTQTGSDISYTAGHVGIGVAPRTGEMLAVAGNIIGEQVRVELQGQWPDYVFHHDYELPTLEEVQRHIQENGHLINVPSATEIEADGIDLGEMNKLLLEKVEELTLYLLRQDVKRQQLEARIKELENNN